jgi:hypothetical protein
MAPSIEEDRFERVLRTDPGSDWTHRYHFLSTNLRGVLERHRSTRALFEHSWRLLSEGEQTVLGAQQRFWSRLSR